MVESFYPRNDAAQAPLLLPGAAPQGGGSPRLVDMAKPVEIVVNGKSAFSGVVAADLRFLLEQWADDEDRGLVYRARIPVGGDAAR